MKLGLVSNLELNIVFGSVCYALVPKEKRTKLDSRSLKCTMIGYFDEKTSGKRKPTIRGIRKIQKQRTSSVECCRNKQEETKTARGSSRTETGPKDQQDSRQSKGRCSQHRSSHAEAFTVTVRTYA